MRPVAVALLLASSLAPVACATYSDDLVRAQRAYEGSEDERALAIFRILEGDTSRLTESERAHYAYLRGMTDFRIGYKAESRHWLSLASAMEQKTPGVLPPEWSKKMADAIKELNEEVFTGGIEALTNTPSTKGKGDDSSSDTSSSPADSDSAKKPKKKASDDD
jgi:hypothetical protein